MTPFLHLPILGDLRRIITTKEIVMESKKEEKPGLFTRMYRGATAAGKSHPLVATPIAVVAGNALYEGAKTGLKAAKNYFKGRSKEVVAQPTNTAVAALIGSLANFGRR